MDPADPLKKDVDYSVDYFEFYTIRKSGMRITDANGKIMEEEEFGMKNPTLPNATDYRYEGTNGVQYILSYDDGKSILIAGINDDQLKKIFKPTPTETRAYMGGRRTTRRKRSAKHRSKRRAKSRRR